MSSRSVFLEASCLASMEDVDMALDEEDLDSDVDLESIVFVFAFVFAMDRNN